MDSTYELNDSELLRNDTAIRIHGTTEPGSIGRAVSNGCIRMRNHAVMALFEQVPVGTPVYVF